MSRASSTVARGIVLAAAPTFAVMAAVTGFAEGQPMNSLCSTGPGSVLTGMVPMYLLMSAVHVPPWLDLVFGQGVKSYGAGVVQTAPRRRVPWSAT